MRGGIMLSEVKEFADLKSDVRLLRLQMEFTHSFLEKMFDLKQGSIEKMILDRADEVFKKYEQERK